MSSSKLLIATMNTLILTTALSVAALVAGPQTALAQNPGVSTGPSGGGQHLPRPTPHHRTTHHRTTHHNAVSLGPSGGGQHLARPTPHHRTTQHRTKRHYAVSTGPSGGGQQLPRPTPQPRQ
jgi:hypothetical protein